MKSLLIVCVIGLVAVGGYIGYRNMSGQSEEDMKLRLSKLELHFVENGLRVRPYVMSPEERAMIEKGKELGKAAGFSDEKNFERKDVYIGDLKTSAALRVYATVAEAERAYADYAAKESRTRARYADNSSAYMRDEYHLNGDMILQLRHYESELISGTVRTRQVQLDKAELEKVVEAFKKF